MEGKADGFNIDAIHNIYRVIYILWNEITNIVPTHFGFSGSPDNFGNKNSLFIILIIALILHLTLVLLSKSHIPLIIQLMLLIEMQKLYIK